MLPLTIAVATALAALPVPPGPTGPPQDGGPEATAARSPGLVGGVVVEILPPRHAREIRTPEGFLRVEDPEPEVDDGTVGAFGVYHIEEPGALQTVAAAEPGEAPPPSDRPPPPEPGDAIGPPPTAGPPCRAERQRYLRRLWRTAGIDVERPLDLVEGLGEPGAPTGGPLVGGWLAGVDPIRPLAWDLELRSLARDLAACEARFAAAR